MARFSIDFDLPQILNADAGDHRRFFERGMRLGRSVGDEPSIASFFVAAIIGGTLAGSQKRAERSAGSRVLNHAAACVRRKKFLRQTKHGDEPVHDVGFEFGAGGTGRPQHSLHAQTRRKKIAENSGAGGVAGKVCEKIGRLPVRDARQNQLFDIFQ